MSFRKWYLIFVEFESKIIENKERELIGENLFKNFLVFRY